MGLDFKGSQVVCELRGSLTRGSVKWNVNGIIEDGHDVSRRQFVISEQKRRENVRHWTPPELAEG
jgi:hypothetical protein